MRLIMHWLAPNTLNVLDYASSQACSGSVERAADSLFSHADDLNAAVASVTSASGAAPAGGNLATL